MRDPTEPQAVQARYARRDAEQDAPHYRLLTSASALQAQQERLQGMEPIPERTAQAHRTLPSAVRITEGDATLAPLAEGSQHAVLAFTLFSSLLDPVFRQHMADVLWRWTAPGGGVLVYDFIVDNPGNPDVRGVPLPELRRLFPRAQVQSQRITLAPPDCAQASCGLPLASLGTAVPTAHPPPDLAGQNRMTLCIPVPH